MAENLCSRCFHSYVCEQFNEHRDSTAEYTLCHFYNDHFVDAADVKVVVRCKDCKHWIKKDFQGGDDIYHMEFGGFCPNSRFARYESDFCSRGERRDSDG